MELVRQWAVSGREGDFRVVQMNVLADGLGFEDFIMAPLDSLEWSFRLPRIVHLVTQHDPHILCLQEVNHFDDLNDALKQCGYEGLFHPKKESPCLQYGYPADGLALFWKTAAVTRSGNGKQGYYRKEDGTEMSQAFVIQDFDLSGHPIVVATTHLKAKEGSENDTIRDIQIKQLLKQLDGCTNLILTGDLNTTPESNVYASIQETCHDTYRTVTGSPMEYSTYKIRSTGEKCRTIDFIFTRSSTFVPVNVLKPPNKSDVPYTRLPGHCYPSDHLALVTAMDWK